MTMRRYGQCDVLVDPSKRNGCYRYIGFHTGNCIRRGRRVVTSNADNSSFVISHLELVSAIVGEASE